MQKLLILIFLVCCCGINLSYTCFGNSAAQKKARLDKQCSCQANGTKDVEWNNLHYPKCILTNDNPSLKGHVCQCVPSFAVTGEPYCSGQQQKCIPNKYCPGGLTTYCACQEADGNCEGYIEEFKTDPQGKQCSYCNCKSKSEWTSSSFKVTDVIYDMEKAILSKQPPVVMGSKDIPNASNITQSAEFWTTISLGTTTSFKHTAGIEISLGMAFKAEVPLMLSTEFSMTLTPSYSYEWGNTTSDLTARNYKFTCYGAGKRRTLCEASLVTETLRVPYTMKLKHNGNTNCNCTSKGVWEQVHYYKQKMVVKDKGPCQRIVDGECSNSILHLN